MRREWGDPPGEGGRTGLAFPRPTDATRALLWANAIAFGVLFLVLRFLPDVGEDLYGLFALVPSLWWDWAPFVPLWQLLSYGFLHSPSDPFHILYNLLALYFFGTMVEGIVGARRFLWTYLAALVLGGLAQLSRGFLDLSRGLEQSDALVPTLGASGGVMCIIVAAAVMQPHARVIFILFPLKLRTLALILVGLDVFRMLSPGGSGVAWLVHLTGAAYGFLAVRRRWIWHDPLGAWRSRSNARAELKRSVDEQKLERLLERIHTEGMGSLSRREKSFLKRVSKSRR